LTIVVCRDNIGVEVIEVTEKSAQGTQRKLGEGSREKVIVSGGAKEPTGGAK
jgi:hypothetical protein